MKNAPPHALEDATRLYKAFADPVRLRLLNLLAEDREVCVCHLHEALELPQPTVSRHLAYLRKRSLVAGRKQGLWVYYRRAQPRSNLHRSLLGSLDAPPNDKDVFAQDRARLRQVVSRCDGPP